MKATIERDAQSALLAAEFDRIYERIAGVAENVRPREPSPSLERLQHFFGLSAFERDVLLLCAGAALESRFSQPTLSLAYSSLADPHWSALSRLRPLRYWRLVEIDRGPLLHAPLRIDERILAYLIDVPALDERIEPLVHPFDEVEPVELETRVLAESDSIAQGVRFWRHSSSNKAIVMVAHPGSSASVAFREMCRQTGLRPFELNAADIPQAPGEREELARLWTREAALGSCGLLVRVDDESPRPILPWLQLIRAPVAIEVKTTTPGEQLDGLRLHLRPLSDQERHELWNEHLGDLASRMNGQLQRIVEYFHFDESAIALSAHTARDAIREDGSDPGRTTWQICRRHARRSLENLARRIEPRAGWEDLILPKAQIEALAQIAIHVRRRAIVNNDWGFAARYGRGIGLTALFSGQSGTGKTMAAEVIAAELDLDLYCIDLAAVVSKYIGETEKNLRRLFDAADESGCILLFDEADALFGKRSEVRDSHDRYANLEISYLLQRMEAYRGIAILTTNMQHAIDPAFMRRLRFIVHFPFPDAVSRAEIWRRVFPSATPLANLDYSMLAQLNVSGGVIRNIATHAAFFAADEGLAVSAKHVMAAARTEYAKLDRPLTPAETRGMC